MSQRALHVLRLVGPFVIACVLTWGVSWLIQFICSITIEGQRFDIASREVNRLAFATVATVIVVALLVMFLLTLNGCWLFIWCFFCLPTVLSGAGWVATATFPGTPVATTLAQIIYAIAMVIWGIVMWYVFLEEVTNEIIDQE